MAERKAVCEWLDDILQPARIKDYAPNGLQVEGRTSIDKVLLGVTASQALIDEAVRWGADAMLVHHGWFWRSEPLTVTGQKYRRMKTVLANDINLIGYHLPLDVHPDYGNNAALGDLLGFEKVATHALHGVEGLLWEGLLSETMSAAGLGQLISGKLAREPLLLGSPDKHIRRIAWCTGGAQDAIDDAIALGVDAYISGEASEQTFHAAVENDIVYFAAGHDATERYGVQRLGAALAERFGLETRFHDLGNPV